jgi:hypothetical protein
MLKNLMMEAQSQHLILLLHPRAKSPAFGTKLTEKVGQERLRDN